MPDLDPRLRRAILAALIAVLSAFGITVAFTTGAGQTSVTITVKGPAGPTALTTTTEALDDARRSEVGDHADSRDESPAGATNLAGAVRQQQRFAATDDQPLTLPDAAPQQRGCRTRLVRNYSSRGGIRPRLLVMHYTVSPNRPGFTDVNAITALFDRASFAASSHYVVDRNGNCNYIVREGDKAWTQAAGNPVSISWEIINTGSERPLFTSGGKRRMARVVSDVARRWDIPVRRGRVSNCRVIRSGVIDHNTFGACGGNHHDITPFNVGDVIAATQSYRRSTSITARRCRELAAIRRDIRRHRSTPAQRDRARTLKRVLGDRARSCR